MTYTIVIIHSDRNENVECNVYNTFAQDGRDLLHACARGGNENLVKWLVQEFEPPMTLTKVHAFRIFVCTSSVVSFY